MRHLVIPKNLKLAKLLNRYPMPAIAGFHVDKLYFICDSIYSMMNYLDAEKNLYPGKSEPFYVPLSADILAGKLGNTYKAIINWMEKAGIIECDGSWEAGVISQGYRFTNKYADCGRRWITVTYHRFLIKKPEKHVPEGLRWQIEKRVIGSLAKWFTDGKLCIDAVEADRTLQSLRITEQAEASGAEIASVNRRYYQRKYAIDVLKNKTGRIIQDSFGYRLHTVLTQLKKELRYTVTYGGEQLIQLDIKNSQLFFITYLLDWQHWYLRENPCRKKREIWKGISQTIETTINRYNTTIMFLKSLKNLSGGSLQKLQFVQDSCKGRLYESVGDSMTDTSLKFTLMNDSQKRSFVKQTLIKKLYSRARTFCWDMDYNSVWNSFLQLYPEVERIVTDIKGRHYTDICKLLQRIESIAIICYVCKTIQKTHSDVPLFTLHDCLVTTENNALLVKQIMEEQICQFTGFTPMVELTHWKDYNTDYDTLKKAA